VRILYGLAAVRVEFSVYTNFYSRSLVITLNREGLLKTKMPKSVIYKNGHHFTDEEASFISQLKQVVKEISFSQNE
jgi:hypothetical protein